MNQPSREPAATLSRFVVGGAVRDRLLGLPVRDRDWVVVGATPETMSTFGFVPVGKDFPVFLHPDTHEEHALARAERKSGRGYHGFTFHTGSDVTLEADLFRRDLTVNAIAEAGDGSLVDPYGGVADLEARVLRHVSPAFAEDPVRVLRVARFAARFAPLGFTVHPETMALMREIVAAGEVDVLTPERVWKETEKALMCDKPSVYFQVLHDCGALARVMPEVDALSGVPQRPEHHPEVDTLVHTLMVVDQAARLGANRDGRVAALLHDLGKAVTPRHQWPRHINHEGLGVPLVEAFCSRLRLPSSCLDLAVAVAAEHLNVHRAEELRPARLLELMERFGVFRAPERFEQALLACEADARGRLGLEDRDYPQSGYVRAAAAAAREVLASVVVANGFQGAAVGAELRERRVRRLSYFKAERKKESAAASMC